MNSSDYFESESEVDTGNVPQKRKRGIRRPEKYKRNKIRNAKVKGTEHTKWKGNVVQVRQTGPPCRYIFSRFCNIHAKMLYILVVERSALLK